MNFQESAEKLSAVAAILQGKTVAIYSSGSVLAQKLIFKYSNHGDLSRFIADHFDTRVGGKKKRRVTEQSLR